MGAMELCRLLVMLFPGYMSVSSAWYLSGWLWDLLFTSSADRKSFLGQASELGLQLLISQDLVSFFPWRPTQPVYLGNGERLS